MKFMRVLRLRFGLVGSVFAVAVVTVGIIAIASAGPSAKSATAADTTVSCASGTDVQTTSGPVCGITVGTVNEWLGIPYAAPPVGTAALAATTAADAVEHDAAGNGIWQRVCSDFPPFPSGGSENCLFVNVWRPADEPDQPAGDGPHPRRRVRRRLGNGDNTLLATTGHEVIVSMNYRLSIFGFLAEQGAWAPTPATTGCRTSRRRCAGSRTTSPRSAAIRTTVTIFGESAGGSSVCDQIASPTAKGLFEQRDQHQRRIQHAAGSADLARVPGLQVGAADTGRG